MLKNFKVFLSCSLLTNLAAGFSNFVIKVMPCLNYSAAQHCLFLDLTFQGETDVPTSIIKHLPQAIFWASEVRFQNSQCCEGFKMALGMLIVPLNNQAGKRKP